jgi:hypothetical protein
MLRRVASQKFTDVPEKFTPDAEGNKIIWKVGHYLPDNTVQHVRKQPSSQIKDEPHGQVVNTPASYSGGPGLNLGTETGVPDCDSSWFSSVPPRDCRDSTLKLVHNIHFEEYSFLVHNRFPPNHFQFIIHFSYHSRQQS